MSGEGGVSQEAVPCKTRFLRGYDFERHMSLTRKGLDIPVSFATNGQNREKSLCLRTFQSAYRPFLKLFQGYLLSRGQRVEVQAMFVVVVLENWLGELSLLRIQG